jgi:hypothetical protein
VPGTVGRGEAGHEVACATPLGETAAAGRFGPWRGPAPGDNARVARGEAVTDELLLDAAGVRVTAERLTFGGKSCVLAGLTAARGPDRLWPGCAAGCLDFGGLLTGALAGGVFESFAVMLLFAPQRHKVVLVTPDGEVTGPRRLKPEGAEAITSAVSRAIARRR